MRVSRPMIGAFCLISLYTQEYGALMAGVLFMLLQREFVAGLTAGAVKG